MEFSSDNRGISIYTFSKITWFHKNVDIRDFIKKLHNLEQISMILLRSESSIEESMCNETPLMVKDNEDCLAEGTTTAGIKLDGVS